MTALHRWWNVEVRDDHDGGSVWYAHEDYMDTLEGAEDLAQRVSLVRDNGAARVVEVTAVPVCAFQDGARGGP